MKLKQMTRRIIAVVLSISMLLTVLPTNCSIVFAESGKSGETILATLSDEVSSIGEAKAEAQSDSIADVKVRAGDWRTAIYKDHLVWNRFHTEVQKDIFSRYMSSKEIKLEYGIEFVNASGKKTGKKGRADIAIKEDGSTYLWEVKPYSYSVNPKKLLGEEQLSKYIFSGNCTNEMGYVKDGSIDLSKTTYFIGDASTISSSSCTFSISDTVSYVVTYTVQNNGLILYKFKRYEKKKEPEPEPSPVTVSVPSKNKTESYTDTQDYGNNDQTDKPSGEGLVAIDPYVYLTLVATATTLQAANVAINRNPNTWNSVSEAIIAACESFKTTVAANLPKVLKTAGASAAGITGAVMVSKTNVYAQELQNAQDDFMTAVEIYCGEDMAAAVSDAIQNGDEDALNDITDSLQDLADEYDQAGNAQPPRDPLVVDLGTDGIELSTLADGVNFDLDNNGFAEKTAWIGNEDGFIALDRNKNGKIDNGGELFGDQVTLSSGALSSSGFEALAEYDINGDKVIDKEDDVYGQLLIWIDKNHNGVSEMTELSSLEETGITSIGLEHKETSVLDETTGTLIAETSEVVLENGKTTEASEFWFPVKTSDTTHGDIKTTGNITNIYQALAEDETGELAKLVYTFVESNDIAEKRCCIKEILYFLAGASDIEANSRGGNIDARDLKVIEECMGRGFEGVDGTCPNVNAAAILKDIYGTIEDGYYNMLNLNSSLGGYWYSVVEYQDEDGKDNLLLNLPVALIDEKISDGEDVDSILYDFCLYLAWYDEMHQSEMLSAWSEHFSAISTHYAEVIELAKTGYVYIGTEKADRYSGTNQNSYIFGKAGDDQLSGGSGSDRIYGEDGSDKLYGNAGNDILSGGSGDDCLDGGSGNDILYGGNIGDTSEDGDDEYVFSTGYGQDIIVDYGGSNTIRFTGVSSKDIRVNGVNEYDAEIRIQGTNDTLTLKNFCKDEAYTDYTLIFRDKKIHCLDEDSPFHYIYGTETEDSLKAVVENSYMYGYAENDTIIGSAGKDIIYGNAGDDQIEAGDGADTVYGGDGKDQIKAGDGDDILFGGAGADILCGNKGNDYMFGEEGDDTYIFDKGDGVDVIEDNSGTSTIQFGEGIHLNDLTAMKVGDDLFFLISGTADRLVVTGYSDNPERFIVYVGEDEVDVSDILTKTDAAELPQIDGETDSSPDVTEEIPQIATPTDADASDDAMDSSAQASDKSDVSDNVNIISGTENSDAVFAENSKNFIFAGAEYDYIVGGSNADYIFGDRDVDRILAGDDADVVYGMDGDDQIFGENGDDIISGGAGNDYVSGGAGNDVVISQSGNDFIDGGADDDTYYISPSCGTVTIKDTEGKNTIVCADGLESTKIKAYRLDWNDLLIVFKGTETSIVIKNYCINEDARGFRLIFADGLVEYATASVGVLRTINDWEGTEYHTSIYTDGTTIVAENGDDQLNGSEASDNLIGGDGNNRIAGNGGDDYLDGGKGTDMLYGGVGADVYIYQKGYGTDTISDAQGENIIEITGYGISDIKAYRTNWNNLTMILDGSGEAGLSDSGADKLIIENFFVSDANRQYKVICDGSVFGITDFGSPCRTLYGTAGSDYMLGFDGGRMTYYGLDGADTLNGSDGTDVLYGGTGDDRILGGNGNDCLLGEAGNDYLEGGAGNDTYYFGIGYGTDSISDNSGINEIIFCEGLKCEDILVERTNWNDLTIRFAGSEDALVLLGYFTSDENKKFNLVFSDGVKYEYDAQENPILQELSMGE